MTRDEPDDLAGESESPEPEQPPVMPTAAEAALQRPSLPRPGPVRYAFVVWVAAGVVGVASALLMLINKRTLIDVMVEANRNPNVTNEQIAQGATTLLWMLFIASIVFATLFTLFAYKAQDGIRKARLILTMLCAVTVLFHYLLFRTPLGLVSGLLAVVGTVLLYTPKAAEYFRANEPSR